MSTSIIDDMADCLQDTSHIKYRLLKASVALLIKHGYHKMKMEDVAKACDVKLSTVYFYFPKKEKYIEALIALSLKRFQLALFDCLSQEDIETTSFKRLIINKLLSFLVKDEIGLGGFLFVLEFPRINFSVNKLMHQYIKEWENFFHSLISIFANAHRYLCYLQGAVVLSYSQDSSEKLEDFSTEFISHINQSEIVKAIM